MSVKNYYLILGIKFSATQDEIKIAYRHLAKKFHPDLNPGNKHIEEKFKEISEAYNTLSDEENKRKYDVKFLYSKNANSFSHRTETKHAPKYKRKPDPPLSKKEKRTVFLMLAGGVSFVVFMAVMSFFLPQYDEKEMTHQIIANDKFQSLNPPEQPKSTISTSDSPYEKYFGGDADSYDSRSSIFVNNNLLHGAIVCLVETKEPHHTIRNEYIEPGSSYRFASLPDGIYYIKAYFGNIWQPAKKMNGGTISGGFEKEEGFFKSDDKKNQYKIFQSYSGDNLVYTNYEIILSKIFESKSKEISEKEFFKK